MERTWKKQYYKPGDEHEIQELFKLVFGKEMGKSESKDHWNWEFMKNPNGPGEILLAVDHNKIVGHYAVIPEKIKIKDKQVMGTLSLDTMVHPDYQGQRIFTILASSLYEDIGKKDMPITYGFPNKNSIHGITSTLDWVEISTLPVLQLTIGSEKVITKALKSKILGKMGSLFVGKKRLSERPETSGKDWEIEKIDIFDEEFDDIFNHGAANIKVITVRDNKYLNWRFIEKPENDYECFCIFKNDKKYGYIVLKSEEKFDLNSGFVVDYFSKRSDPELDTLLISWGMDYLNYHGVDIVIAMMFSHIPYYKIFRKLGYFRIPRKMFPKDIYFSARKNNEDVDFNMVSDKNSWYLTWGDTDVI